MIADSCRVNSGKAADNIWQHLVRRDRTPLTWVKCGHREALFGSGGAAHQAAESLSKAVIMQQFGPSDPALGQKEEQPGATLGHPSFEAEKRLTNTMTLQPKHRAAT